MCGLTVWNRVRNEVRRRAQVERHFSGKVDHLERMDEELMAKQVMISDVEGNRCRCSPRLGLMDGVRMALGKRDTSLEQGRLNTLDRRWELIVRSEYC